MIDIYFGVDSPPSKRSARVTRVRWLDPAAVNRWRDVGLRSHNLRGHKDRSCRTRNEQRDVAFFDGLYGTGLRLSEWASVAIDELPTLDVGRLFYKRHLADKCAKGGYGHPYWMPQHVLTGVCAYAEGAHARAIRSAQNSGRYEQLSDAIVVGVSERRGTLRLPDGNGGFIDRPWNATGPALRRRMFRRAQAGLEPLWLWLNENGLPRDPHAPRPSLYGVRMFWFPLRVFLNWLHAHGVTTFGEVTPEVLDDYLAFLAGNGDRLEQTYRCVAEVRRLWGYRTVLPQAMRLPEMPPWGGDSAGVLLGKGSRSTMENLTPRINEDTMQALLLWALRFVEDSLRRPSL